ncbi:Na+/H+ antiporter subunit E [Roseospira goensis]|uniref:Multicomponent Na+:H+ antiporter subunit E n=1 Tax=Roseospira goensis TaxID=391922 RepID=A0A7W6RW99_9PROT|nr:Na+/H+ antiporter subunit E [Roseospira goensis]MBB4284419.1 multicomponent Na+:H+ antiporter subunit E [Roseospira goensis]
MHAVNLFVSLYALWLLLSGHWSDPLLLGLGAASAALAVFVAWRMEGLDHEGVPVRIALRTLAYWPWLLGQIVLSNLAVARCVLDPGRIRPRMAWVPASQKSDLGQVIYANSITLTPGTIAVHIDGGRILVHALEGASIDDLRAGDMDRRCTRVEGDVGPGETVGGT